MDRALFVGITALIPLCLVVLVWAAVKTRSPQGSVPVARVEMASLAKALAEYRREFGAYPEGSPGKIGRALCGENPAGRTFYSACLYGGRKVGRGGELLDIWGSPYEFEFQAGGVRIRSAGANRVPGDEDDLVLDGF
ncbi:MAG: type II secretion system protein GspG [Candidatus Methanosuratincola sp.]